MEESLRLCVDHVQKLNKAVLARLVILLFIACLNKMNYTLARYEYPAVSLASYA
ncbi:hypothetical protein ACE8EZ_14865 [Pantoea deleyi]|uniref:hypothetical protein n=1 Tax=Pantoea deleyi TaxID=470932 RepID=UPI0035D42DA9